MAFIITAKRQKKKYILHFKIQNKHFNIFVCLNNKIMKLMCTVRYVFCIFMDVVYNMYLCVVSIYLYLEMTMLYKV